MLATKRLVGVAPEMNLTQYVRRTPLKIMNKATHSGFEPKSRHHQKSKTEVSLAPHKGHMASKKFVLTKATLDAPQKMRHHSCFIFRNGRMNI